MRGREVGIAAAEEERREQTYNPTKSTCCEVFPAIKLDSGLGEGGFQFARHGGG